MGTISDSLTESPAGRYLTKTERYRVALLESLAKHEIRGGFREIGKTVKGWNSLSQA